VHQSVLLCLSQVKKVCRSVRIVPGPVRTVKWLSLRTVRFVKMIYGSWILLCRSVKYVNGCCLSLRQWVLSASLARNVCRSVRIVRPYELWNGFTYRTVRTIRHMKWFTDGEPTLPNRKVRQWVLLCLGQE
jgi:hypothetical protein